MSTCPCSLPNGLVHEYIIPPNDMSPFSIGPFSNVHEQEGGFYAIHCYSFGGKSPSNTCR